MKFEKEAMFYKKTSFGVKDPNTQFQHITMYYNVKELRAAETALPFPKKECSDFSQRKS